MLEIVYTTGAFDLLHIGHLHRLRGARALGDSLIVGIMSDKFIIRSKEKNPVACEKDRAELVNALSCVDAVFIVDDHATDFSLIEKHGITIRVVGPEYGWAEGHRQSLIEMERHGIKIVVTDRMPGISTTEIVERIRGGCNG